MISFIVLLIYGVYQFLKEIGHKEHTEEFAPAYVYIDERR